MSTESDKEQLILRFLNEECTPEEKEQVQEYFRQLDLAEEALTDDPQYHPSPLQTTRMRTRVIKAINATSPRFRLKWMQRAAAVLVPLIILMAVFMHYNNKNNQQPVKLTSIVNNAQTVKYIRLADSSEIWLNSGASITLNEKYFHSNRNITLSGEAYFQVTHDAEHPFSVNTGKLSTTVLGTTFSIRTDTADAQTMVALLTGKVRVAAEGSTGRVLIPGESVVYDHAEKRLQPASLPFYFLAWKNKELKCDNEPLINIIQYLNTWYSRSIRLKPEMHQLTYSGSLPLESNLSVTLNRLLFVHQLQYKITGNDVLIY